MLFCRISLLKMITNWLRWSSDLRRFDSFTTSFVYVIEEAVSFAEFVNSVCEVGNYNIRI